MPFKADANSVFEQDFEVFFEALKQEIEKKVEAHGAVNHGVQRLGLIVLRRLVHKQDSGLSPEFRRDWRRRGEEKIIKAFLDRIKRRKPDFDLDQCKKRRYREEDMNIYMTEFIIRAQKELQLPEFQRKTRSQMLIDIHQECYSQFSDLYHASLGEVLTPGVAVFIRGDLWKGLRPRLLRTPHASLVEAFRMTPQPIDSEGNVVQSLEDVCGAQVIPTLEDPDKLKILTTGAPCDSLQVSEELYDEFVGLYRKVITGGSAKEGARLKQAISALRLD